MVPLCPTHSRANLQNGDGKSKVGSSFSCSQWLSCSLFTLIAHSSPQNLPTCRFLHTPGEARLRLGKLAQSSTESISIIEPLAQCWEQHRSFILVPLWK